MYSSLDCQHKYQLIELKYPSSEMLFTCNIHMFGLFKLNLDIQMILTRLYFQKKNKQGAQNSLKHQIVSARNNFSLKYMAFCFHLV